MKRLFQTGEKPAGLFHVLQVLIAEPFGHVGFLDRHSGEVERPEHHQEDRSGDQVVEQQRHGEGPKPQGGVHGMPHMPIDAVLYQRLLAMHARGEGEVDPQVGVGPPQEEERQDDENGTQPGHGVRDGVVREVEVRSENESQWGDHAGHDQEDQQLVHQGAPEGPPVADPRHEDDPYVQGCGSADDVDHGEDGDVHLQLRSGG